jgi:hypothetical protein
MESLSRIAMIDTAINRKYINNKMIEHINLCENSGDDSHSEISHGTLCAMVLDYCASDYELVNIQIFKDSKGKVFGEIGRLAQALRLCQELSIDVISLSAVSSVLSDSKHLYGITHELSKNTVIASALDNRQYMTVPTSYPCVLGVRCDYAGLLSPGEIAFSATDPFGANIYANCDFLSLREFQRVLSNSLATPVATAYVNNLLNQGLSISDIRLNIQNLKPYPICKEHNEIGATVSSAVREIPIVSLVDETADMCRVIMDSLYAKYEVQSTALSLAECPYDVRIKTVTGMDFIQDHLRFMARHYKTDLIFIVGKKELLTNICQIVDVDVELSGQGDSLTVINYENKQELVLNQAVPDRLHEILTS